MGRAHKDLWGQNKNNLQLDTTFLFKHFETFCEIFINFSNVLMVRTKQISINKDYHSMT